MKYDYLVVGAGLYGAVFAHEAKKAGKSVLVIDKRANIAGNVYTEPMEGIQVHKYGAHIFHTNNKKVWEYVNQFAVFNRFTNSPVANYKGELYSLPFNMYTFNKMWGVTTPEEAAAKIEEQRKEAGITEPENLEEQAISLVGRDIYEKLIKGYTEKQWGRPCTELPSFIIKRLPVRLTFDNNYFNALYQGIPVGGYTQMVANMLEGIEVELNADYLKDKEKYDAIADKVVYTGAIDAYFDYKLGTLEYRSVRFETELLDMPNFQGNAAVNYTDAETPWTRMAMICQKLLSLESFHLNGNREMSLTILLMTIKIVSFIQSTESLRTGNQILFLVDVLGNTSIMIWMRLLLLRWICVRTISS